MFLRKFFKKGQISKLFQILRLGIAKNQERRTKEHRINMALQENLILGISSGCGFIFGSL